MANPVISGSLGSDNAVVSVDAGNNTAFSGVVSGTFSGTVTFQVLYDATEGWVSATCFTRVGATAAATLTAAGNRMIDTTGALAIRATIHPYVSGTANVTLTGAVGVNAAAGGAVPAGGTTTLGAGTATAGNVGGVEAVLAATFTRPADTTAYAANDAICNSTSAPAALTFANAALTTGHGGVVLGATIIDQANQATALQATLHLFSAVPGTLTNDNAALALANADLANYVGSIKFTTATVTNTAAGASGNVALTGTLPNPLPYVCAATSLFGVLQGSSAYTPVSAEVFRVLLNCSLDA